jgi:carboxymethylenebutenolidase
VAGYALSAGPAIAQTAINTDPTGIAGEDIKVKVNGGEMPGYIAAPEKAGKYPTVLVVPEIFGMHRYQQDICRRLAKIGYVGVTFDPFFRTGDLSKISDIKEVLGKANSLADDVMLADLDALTAMVSKHKKVNAAKLGITGMCRGGRTVWMAVSHSKAFKAGVSWYGGLNPTPPAQPKTPIDVAGALNAPVLGLYAGADGGIPVNKVAEMQEALARGNKNSKASTFILYPNVPHAFHADYRPSYRKAEAEAGWKEMLAWFKSNGVA